MENKVLSANIDAVSKYDKSLADRILRVNKTKSTYELAQNPNGEYNLVLNGLPLHSVDGAALEAKQIADKIPDMENKNSTRVIYGLGLGWLADEFIGRSGGIVIIYEPDLELLRSVFEVLEFGENLSKKNVILTDNRQKLLEIIDMLSDKETKITVSFLQSYHKLYKDDIYALAGLIERTRGEKQANLNTINKIARVAVANTLHNLDNITKTPIITTLKDRFKGKCAVIASAGPSLAQNIKTIKLHRDKFILFAVGPSMKLLSDNNIKPDFLCIVEAQNTKGQIENIDLEDVNLIFEPFSHEYLWNLKVKNKFLFFSKDNFLNDWFANALNIDISGLKTVGTVSYCALSSAKIMGFKKIILCGQNLAFKDGSCYAKGSAYEDLECILNPETNKYEIRAKDFERYKLKLLGETKAQEKNADKKVEGYIRKLNRTLYSVAGQDGKMLPTQACYAIFIKHFEEFAKNNPDICYINSSAGGAQINGYENLALEEALLDVEPLENTDIKAVLPDYTPEGLKRAKEIMVKDYLLALPIIQNAYKYGEEAAKELSRRKTINTNVEKLLDKTEKYLEEFVKKFYSKPYMYFMCAVFTNKYQEKIKKMRMQKNINDIIKRHQGAQYMLERLQKWLESAASLLSDK